MHRRSEPYEPNLEAIKSSIDFLLKYAPETPEGRAEFISEFFEAFSDMLADLIGDPAGAVMVKLGIGAMVKDARQKGLLG